MLYLESFFVRRLIIGRATANINRILLAVVTEMDPAAPADEAVRAYLSAGRKYYATDAEIRAATPAIPLYLNGRDAARTGHAMAGGIVRKQGTRRVRHADHRARAAADPHP